MISLAVAASTALSVPALGDSCGQGVPLDGGVQVGAGCADPVGGRDGVLPPAVGDSRGGGVRSSGQNVLVVVTNAAV
jgi:hypothetical protein